MGRHPTQLKRQYIFYNYAFRLLYHTDSHNLTKKNPIEPPSIQRLTKENELKSSAA